MAIDFLVGFILVAALLTGTVAADVWTTLKALSLGYGERNPIVNFFMRIFGVKAGIFVAKGIYIAAIAAYAVFFGLDVALLVVMLIGAALHGFVAFRNHRLYTRGD